MGNLPAKPELPELESQQAPKESVPTVVKSATSRPTKSAQTTLNTERLSRNAMKSMSPAPMTPYPVTLSLLSLHPMILHLIFYLTVLEPLLLKLRALKSILGTLFSMHLHPSLYKLERANHFGSRATFLLGTPKGALSHRELQRTQEFNRFSFCHLRRIDHRLQKYSPRIFFKGTHWLT